MTPEQANQMLKSYRECLGRTEYLAQHLTILDKKLAYLKSTVVEDSICVSPQLSDMPKAQSVGDPTSKLALKIVDGYETEEIKQLTEEIRCVRAELERKLIVITFVNAWLVGLTEKERWIIEKHILDGMYWREITHAYEGKFGDMYSKEGLKRIKKAALVKIHHIAE